MSEMAPGGNPNLLHGELGGGGGEEEEQAATGRGRPPARRRVRSG